MTERVFTCWELDRKFRGHGDVSLGRKLTDLPFLRVSVVARSLTFLSPFRVLMVFQVQMVYQETVVPKVRLVTKVIVPSYPCPIWVEKERKGPKEIKELREKAQVRVI